MKKAYRVFYKENELDPGQFSQSFSNYADASDFKQELLDTNQAISADVMEAEIPYWQDN